MLTRYRRRLEVVLQRAFEKRPGVARRSLLRGNWASAARLELRAREVGDVYITEAKQYLGRNVSVTYRDRRGDLHTRSLHVHEVAFFPIYGVCLLGDMEEIWLDRVVSITTID